MARRPQRPSLRASQIRDSLISVDPGGEATYRTNAAAYLTRLDQLDATMASTIATIPSERRKLVTTNDAYAYLANGAPARVGYHVTFSAPVVLEPRHGSWVFQPTSLVAGHPDRAPVTITGERPSAPAVGGDTRVATFNVPQLLLRPGRRRGRMHGLPRPHGGLRDG